MKNGNITCVIVKDLSRLGRNYIEVGNYIEQIFPIFNVRFIAINDNVDSYKNPAGSNTILIPFKNLINDEYCRDTSIKIKSALNGRKKKGEFVGAFSAYGYIKDKENPHKLIVDKESAEIVKKIFEWKVNEGIGNLKICHRLNSMGILNPTGYKIKVLNQKYHNSSDYTWGVSTIRNILKNDIYIGNVTQGKRRVKSYKLHKLDKVPKEEWITVRNMHEPIIEKELFEKAQNLMKKDTRVRKNGSLSIWAGILKCADCKRAMHKKYSKNKSGKVYEYYICGTYRKKSNELCTKHTIKQSDLERAVLEVIKYHISKFVDIEKILNELELSEKKPLENSNIEKQNNIQIEKIRLLKKGLYEDLKNGIITKEEYLEYKEDYKKQIENLEQALINLKKQNEEEANKENENVKWIEEFKKQKNIMSLDRTIIDELIEYIEVHENNKITIKFNFKNDKTN